MRPTKVPKAIMLLLLLVALFRKQVYLLPTLAFQHGRGRSGTPSIAQHMTLPSTSATMLNLLSSPSTTTGLKHLGTPRSPTRPSGMTTSVLDAAAIPSAASTAAILSSPLLQILPIQVLIACSIPTCLGYYKSEYGVSYAYGLATSVSGYLIFKKLLSMSMKGVAGGAVGSLASALQSISLYHCASLVFYGVRLCIFLYIRTTISQRMKDMNKRIEQRAKDRGSRFARTPFLVNCSLLYFGLCTPLLLSSNLVQVVASTSSKSLSATALPFQSFAITALKALVGIQWLGFVIAAWGDVTKTFVKKVLQKNENYLVTSGIFSVLRHPNYTGEMISWTCNNLVGLITSIMTVVLMFITKNPTKNLGLLGLYTALSLLGNVGIVFVLLQATKNLELRQEQEYGNDVDDPNFEKFIRWKQSSWGGLQLPTSEATPTSTPADSDDRGE